MFDLYTCAYPDESEGGYRLNEWGNSLAKNKITMAFHPAISAGRGGSQIQAIEQQLIRLVRELDEQADLSGRIRTFGRELKHHKIVNKTMKNHDACGLYKDSAFPVTFAIRHIIFATSKDVCHHSWN